LETNGEEIPTIKTRQKIIEESLLKAAIEGQILGIGQVKRRSPTTISMSDILTCLDGRERFFYI